jgi:hypothetical protein
MVKAPKIPLSDRQIFRIHNKTHLSDYSVRGYSKILEGVVEQVIIDEITHQNYDLVAVAAEAYGNFVSRVLLGIQKRHSYTIRAFLVIKP